MLEAVRDRLLHDAVRRHVGAGVDRPGRADAWTLASTPAARMPAIRSSSRSRLGCGASSAGEPSARACKQPAHLRERFDSSARSTPGCPALPGCCTSRSTPACTTMTLSVWAMTSWSSRDPERSATARRARSSRSSSAPGCAPQGDEQVARRSTRQRSRTPRRVRGRRRCCRRQGCGVPDDDRDDDRRPADRSSHHLSYADTENTAMTRDEREVRGWGVDTTATCRTTVPATTKATVNGLRRRHAISVTTLKTPIANGPVSQSLVASSNTVCRARRPTRGRCANARPRPRRTTPRSIAGRYRATRAPASAFGIPRSPVVQTTRSPES